MSRNLEFVACPILCCKRMLDPGMSREVVTLSSVAVEAERDEIVEIVWTTTCNRDSVANFEPYADAAGSTPNTRKMIAPHDKEALAERNWLSVATCGRIRGPHNLCRHGGFVDRVGRLEQGFLPRTKPAKHRIAGNGIAVGLEIFSLRRATFFLQHSLPELHQDGQKLLIRRVHEPVRAKAS